MRPPFGLDHMTESSWFYVYAMFCTSLPTKPWCLESTFDSLSGMAYLGIIHPPSAALSFNFATYPKFQASNILMILVAGDLYVSTIPEFNVFELSYSHISFSVLHPRLGCYMHVSGNLKPCAVPAIVSRLLFTSDFMLELFTHRDLFDVHHSPTFWLGRSYKNTRLYKYISPQRKGRQEETQLVSEAEWCAATSLV